MRLLGVLLAGGLVAAACGNDDDAETEAPAEEEPADDEGDAEDTEDAAPADIETITAGTLTVCTDAPFEPFEFEDEDTGEFTGFDMELLREISGNLGLEMDVTVVPFDGIFLLPGAGECDIVGSAATILPERQENALFSDPYLNIDQSLLVQADDADTFATLEDMADGTIGVQNATTGQEFANENAPDGAEIVGFDEPSAMFLALESGEIDAILQDLPVNGFRATQNPDLEVTDTFPTDEEYGFAAALENTGLIDAVNAELEALQDDGTYDAIFEEWFSESPES